MPSSARRGIVSEHHAAGHEDGDACAHARRGGVGGAGSLAAGLGGRRLDRSGRQVARRFVHRDVELVVSVRREPDDRFVAEHGTADGHRHVVLADVHAVGAHGECDVGPVVHDERNPEVGALLREARRCVEDHPVVVVLVTQLHDVDATGHALGHEALKVLSDGGAEIERSVAERPGHSLSALAACFIAFLCARTFA